MSLLLLHKAAETKAMFTADKVVATSKKAQQHFLTVDVDVLFENAHALGTVLLHLAAEQVAKDPGFEIDDLEIQDAAWNTVLVDDHIPRSQLVIFAGFHYAQVS